MGKNSPQTRKAAMLGSIRRDKHLLLNQEKRVENSPFSTII